MAAKVRPARAPVCHGARHSVRTRGDARPPIGSGSCPISFTVPAAVRPASCGSLEEIGERYDLTIVTDEFRRSPEHFAKHPLGRVPFMELDDGTVMFESLACCLYLADAHPDAGLIGPSGSTERALAYQWSVFVDDGDRRRR